MSFSRHTLIDMCNACTGQQNIEIEKLKNKKESFTKIKKDKIKLIYTVKPQYIHLKQLEKAYLVPHSNEISLAYRNIRIEAEKLDNIEYCKVYVGGQLFEEIFKDTFKIIKKIKNIKDDDGNIIPFGIFSDENIAFPIPKWHDVIIVVKNTNNVQDILTAEPCYLTYEDKMNVYRLYALKDISKLCNINMKLPDEVNNKIKKFVGRDFHKMNEEIYIKRQWITTHISELISFNIISENLTQLHTVYWNHPTRYIIVNTINNDLTVLNILINCYEFILIRTFKMDNYHVFDIVEQCDGKTLNFSRIDNVRVELPIDTVSVFTIYYNITATSGGMTGLRFCA